MRVVTLFDSETADFLAGHFVLLAHNQVPDLYTAEHHIAEYSEGQVARAIEGSGGGNVRAYFCTSDGHVVSCLSGWWRPKRFTSECHWALSRIKDETADLKSAHEKRAKDFTSERDKAVDPATVETMIATIPCEPSDKASISERLRPVAAFNRLIRSHEEAVQLLDQHIRDVLLRVEEEVYTKGALG
jgi:hypothetical protein